MLVINDLAISNDHCFPLGKQITGVEGIKIGAKRGRKTVLTVILTRSWSKPCKENPAVLACGTVFEQFQKPSRLFPNVRKHCLISIQH